MALAPVAERAGLSRQAVVSRYRDRSDLGADLWMKLLAPTFSAALTDVIAAPGDSADLKAALRPFVAPDQTMRAAAELLLVGRYDPAVSQAIEATLRPILDQWLTPNGRRLSRAQAARHGYLLSLGLGLLMQARRFRIEPSDLDSELNGLSAALESPTTATKLPVDSLEHVDLDIDFGTGNPEWEILLQATLDEIGNHGYEASTLDTIARAAGCTQGLIYSHYASKRDLFLDASDRSTEQSANANNEFWRTLASRRSEGIAQATIIREYMTPARKQARTVMMEQCRLSWHDSELLTSGQKAFTDAVWQIANENPDRPAAQLRAYVYTGLALGLGVAVLADLHPGAWQLPYDVVTVPIFDRQ